jgi:hypothetical protein
MITVIWDSTIFSTFEECPFKFDLAFNQDLQPLKTNEAIEEGDLVHAMMEPYYLSIKGGMDYRDAAHIAIEAGRRRTMDLDLDIPDAEEIIKGFDQYCHFYGQEKFIVLAVETPFAITLHESKEENLRVVYTGKIDLTVRTQHDPIVVYDHKKRRQNRKINRKSNQFIGYCLATNTSIMYVNSFGIQTSLKPHEKFQRIPLNYMKGQKDLWRDNVINWARLYVAYHQMNVWPQNFTSCDKFSGCHFNSICDCVSKEQMENHKIQFFKKRPEKWDPTKPLKDGAAKGYEAIRIELE